MSFEFPKPQTAKIVGFNPEIAKQYTPQETPQPAQPEQRKMKTQIAQINFCDYLKIIAEKFGYEVKGIELFDRAGKPKGEWEEKILGSLCTENVLNRYAKIPVFINEKNNLSFGECGNLPEKILEEMLNFLKQHQPSREIKENDSIQEKERKIIREKVARITEKLIKGKLLNLFLDQKKLSYHCDEVHFYTAVNSPLDFQFGIDGWLEIIDKRRNIVKKVTFDLKSGGHKNNQIKADVELNLDDDFLDDKEKLMNALNNFANKVAFFGERR
jgi:hypothetical protein